MPFTNPYGGIQPNAVPAGEAKQKGVIEEYGPAAIRGVGGLFGVTPISGAIAGAGSEVAAQALEHAYGDRQGMGLKDLAEVLSAGATGAVGGGVAKSIGLAVKEGGGALRAMASAAPWVASQPIVHAVTSGQPVSPGDYVKDVATGLGSAALFGKLGQMLRGAPAAAPRAVDEVQNGLQTIRVPRTQAGYQDNTYGPFPTKKGVDISNIQWDYDAGEPDITFRGDTGLPYGGVSDGTESGRVLRNIAREDRARQQGWAQEARNLNTRDKTWKATQNAGTKAKEAGAQADLIEQARQRAIDEGKQPVESVGESYSTKNAAGGRNRLSVGYRTPPAEEGAIPKDLSPEDIPTVELKSPVWTGGTSGQSGVGQTEDPQDLITALRNLASRRTGESVDVQLAVRNFTDAGAAMAPAQATAPAAPAPQAGALANFFKSRVDASGEHYRSLKAAAGMGEQMPTLPGSQSGRTPVNLAGQALQTEAIKEGLPTQRTRNNPLMSQQQAQPQAAPAAPAPESASPLSMEEMRARVMGAKGRPGGADWNNQKGAMSPEMMARLGMAVGGGLLGGAVNPTGNAALSAALGAGAGFFAPDMGRKIAGLATQVAQNRPDISPEMRGRLEQLSTPQGINQVIEEGMRALPQYTRGSMLFGTHLANNAFAAPYGSALTMALEHSAAGDERGTQMLEFLQNPKNFADIYRSHGWNTAKELISQANERSGGEGLPAASNKFEEVAALPGTLMTAGDETARYIAKMFGFTEDEARRYTMTNEPEWRLSKQVMNLQRSHPLAQMLLPFARTNLDIVERAAERTPLLGYLFQAAREHPDPMEMQHIQQLFGAGALAGGGAAGYFGPNDQKSSTGKEVASFWRSLVSNSSGPYAGLADVGMAGGRALAAGKGPRGAFNAGTTAMYRNYPLPSWDIPEQYAKFFVPPEGTERDFHRMPSGMVPSLAQQVYNIVNPQQEKIKGPLASYGRFVNPYSRKS